MKKIIYTSIGIKEGLQPRESLKRSTKNVLVLLSLPLTTLKITILFKLKQKVEICTAKMDLIFN